MLNGSVEIGLILFNFLDSQQLIFCNSQKQFVTSEKQPILEMSKADPPLVQAIFNGDPDEVRALIFKKEDVNFQACIGPSVGNWFSLTILEFLKELLVGGGEMGNKLGGSFLRLVSILVPIIFGSEDEYNACIYVSLLSYNTEVIQKENCTGKLYVSGHIEVVKLLVAHGAEVTCKDKKSYTPLHAAASSGMISVVKYLLDLGVDMNEPNAYGNTPLHVACYNGQDVVVNELIDCGANVNQMNEKGFTPLHFAAASTHGALCLELLVCNGADVNMKVGEPKAIRALLKMQYILEVIFQNPCYGAEIDCEDKNGNTPLHIAARYGHELLINTLITSGADTAKTPLHYAAANCNYQCLFALVGSGASVNDLDERGCTPLHYAAASDTDGKCLEYLLRNDANPGIRDKQGYNAVHYSAAYGHRLCLELLMETSGTDMLNDSDNRAPISPLHLAAYHGHHQALEVLVQSLLDLDVRNNNGRTPLDLAAFKGHVECVDVLINQGASILVKDYVVKRTPIHAAATNGHSECLRLLIGNAEPQNAVDIQDGNGQINDNEGAAEMLIDTLGAGIVNSTDSKGRTPLHAAAFTDHVECLQLLLSHNAQVNAVDSSGKTPLMMAAENGQTNTVEVLVSSAKADLTLQDSSKNTALHLACSKGHETSALLILEKITDRNLINATNAALQTPLHVAARNGLTVVVQELLGKGASVLAVDENGEMKMNLSYFYNTKIKPANKVKSG
ncbi:serine threonine-protein phosphatase 6 regulatory ankyrin repeat subunit a [Limosa lapponica baueri]|uniref:Serine threonine-protein phosphatase 6 regulatory ankyrin repeat subunit a n=1 Tax=Limosa lapponica baueri TaxID=1758121 RepID=A0A2I0TTR3_LIMLA|nr:serine threonine-protein phosphatase 6 regulatory ankyrin repeat subunit a [Limosa lapponica baueri]